MPTFYFFPCGNSYGVVTFIRKRDQLTSNCTRCLNRSIDEKEVRDLQMCAFVSLFIGLLGIDIVSGHLIMSSQFEPRLNGLYQVFATGLDSYNEPAMLQ